MRGPGERLRQLLNRNNPENSFEYDEQQVERVTSVDQANPLHSDPLASREPLATSARRSQVSKLSRENDIMDKHEGPNSTSTLPANGHKLPRPHVGVIRENRKEATGNLDDESPAIHPTTDRFHRISGHGYQHHHYPCPISPMDAEKSILVAKSPNFSRRKVSNSNAFTDVKCNTHLVDKRVHMTVNSRGVAALRSIPSSEDENLPAPDYPLKNDETSKQIPTKEISPVSSKNATTQEKSQSNCHGSSDKSNKSSIINLNLSKMTQQQLEEYTKSLKQPKLIDFCLELGNYIRKLEQQAELREEMLKRSQKQLDDRNEKIEEKDERIEKLEKDLSIAQRLDKESVVSEKNTIIKDLDESVLSITDAVKKQGIEWSIKCCYHESGCPYRLPSMEQHEENECKYKPARCPSLTCPIKPAFANLLKHIEDEHDGKKKGRDRVSRNASNHLISSYVNIDKEPVFYKNTKMTWVANELLLDKKYFYLECMRVPPDWHLWVYILGTEKDASEFQVTITLFREDEYGRIGENGFSAQRSYTGPVISIHRSKEEIAEYGLGFMVHDKQVRPLCGPITNREEQLFGYEVTVYRK